MTMTWTGEIRLLIEHTQVRRSEVDRAANQTMIGYLLLTIVSWGLAALLVRFESGHVWLAIAVASISLIPIQRIFAVRDQARIERERLARREQDLVNLLEARHDVDVSGVTLSARGRQSLLDAAAPGSHPPSRAKHVRSQGAGLRASG